MRTEHPERLERALMLTQLALAAFLFAGLFLSFGIGVADNGDYTRAMGWLTSGPANIEPNWPENGTDAFRRRFFYFWIPYWKLDWPLRPLVLSSTIVLWLPGAVLNWLFYSRRVLYLPFVSFVPRLCLLLVFVAALRWSGWRAAGRAGSWVAATVVGVPLALLFMAQDYVSHFSTFYRDTGTIVFVLGFMVSLVRLDTVRRERRELLFAAVCLALLATAKVTNVYWPLLGCPFLLLARGGRHRVAAVAVIFLLTGALSLAVFRRAELPQIRDYQAYSSLYMGVLRFSSRPADHLSRLGLQETTDFLGKHCYLPETSRWLDTHPGRVSVFTTLDVVLHEPSAFLRELYATSHSMHDIAPRVGVRAEGDPTPPTRGALQQWWCLLKYRVFPRGGALFVALAAFAAVFAAGLRARTPLRQLALLGLFATAGIPAEMMVAIFGAGTGDVTRHFLIANLLFDVATILLVAVGVLQAIHVAPSARAWIARSQPRRMSALPG